MKYLWKFLLVTVGFALVTTGLIAWQSIGFQLRGLWSWHGGYGLHPLHVLAVGIAMVPPALWEIFLLERRSADG